VNWKWEEIILLHKSLVVLPEDYSIKQEVENTVKEPLVENYAVVTQSKTYTQKSILKPFLVFYGQNDKDFYLDTNSAFQKIVIKLGLTHLNDFLFPIGDMAKYSLSFPKGIWILGLSDEKTPSANNMLITPSPEDLNTTEEKLAMYQKVVDFAPKLKK
jgi:hypothetical protein